jgi:hypothetical protein
MAKDSFALGWKHGIAILIFQKGWERFAGLYNADAFLVIFGMGGWKWIGLDLICSLLW